MRPFQGNIKSLDRNECKQVLEENSFVQLSCRHQKTLHLVPIRNTYNNGITYSHTRETAPQV